MIEMLCLASILCLGPKDLDGAAAARRAEHLLRDLGIQDKLTLGTVSGSDWSSDEPSWTVNFSTETKSIAVALNRRTGLPNRVLIHVPDPIVSPSYNPGPPTEEQIRNTRRILGILGYSKELAPETEVGWSGQGPFRVLVHGHPFFNLNPTYGPVLSMDPKTGLLVFYACPPLPLVNAWEPKISASDALGKLQIWGHTRAVQRGLPAVVDPSIGHLVAELGYWKAKGEPTAKLVWRATKYTRVQGYTYGLGALRMFVDALTGEFVEPDDPAWGANP